MRFHIQCLCGCGTTFVPKPYYKNKEKKYPQFISGHNSKLKTPVKSFKKGHIPWITGKKNKPNSGSFKKGNIPAHANRERPEHSKEKHWHWKGGKDRLPKCLICEKKLSRIDAKYCILHRQTNGKNHYNWKGGIDAINKKERRKIRQTRQYKKWRKSVLERDNYTCQHCGTHENLRAHHKKEFSKYIDLRFDIHNGLTLCETCHKTEHKRRVY